MSKTTTGMATEANEMIAVENLSTAETHNTNDIITNSMVNCSEADKATVQNMLDKLSPKGMEALDKTLIECNLESKFQRIPCDKIAPVLVNVINRILVAAANDKARAKKTSGTRKSASGNAVAKKPIVQVDPDTGEILAKFDSIQDANRAMQELHNAPTRRFDSSICGCVQHKKGFFKAGGFCWESADKLPEGTGIGDILDLMTLKPQSKKVEVEA